MNVIRQSLKISRPVIFGGVIALTALFCTAATSTAEVLDLGQIPKGQVQGWCKAHGGDYYEGIGYGCFTKAGNWLHCDDQQNCQGAVPPARVQAGQPAFPGLGTGGTRAQVRPRGIGGLSGGVMVPPRPGGPRAVAATSDVSCGDGKNYTISTGTQNGECRVVRDGGKIIGGYCGDSKGNGSSVFCGQGCTGATGAGSCSAAKAQ